MKMKKILAGLLALAVIGCGVPYYCELTPQITIIANAAEEFGSVYLSKDTSGLFYSVVGFNKNATEVVIPSEFEGLPVKEIGLGYGTLRDGVNFTSITIPDSIVKIGDKSFQNCSLLKEITIPDSVTEMGNYVFQGCTSLTSVKLSENITNMGKSAFASCTSLEEITIPAKVNEILYHTFYNCTSLKNVNFEGDIYKIGGEAFYNCTSLTEFIVPDTVLEMGGSTDESADIFVNCTSLTKVVLPKKLKNLGHATFQNCTALKEVVLPDTLTLIYGNAFENCSSLETIDIPENLSTVNVSAFEGCSKLKEIVFSENIQSIGTDAFKDCSSMEKIIIKNGDCLVANTSDTIFASTVIYSYPSSSLGITGPLPIPPINYAERYNREFVNLAELTVSDIKGDANEDGEVGISDAVAVAAFVANSDKNPLSEQAQANADVYMTGDGLNASDAFAIQQFATGIIKEL